MSTPAFTLATVTGTASNGGATAMKVQCNDLSGAPVNISSGYTATVKVSPSGNANPGNSAVDISTSCTFTYGSTGLLTIFMTPGVAGSLPGQNNNCAVFLTNDGGTTHSLVALGSINMSTQDPTN